MESVSFTKHRFVLYRLTGMLLRRKPHMVKTTLPNTNEIIGNQGFY